MGRMGRMLATNSFYDQCCVWLLILPQWLARDDPLLCFVFFFSGKVNHAQCHIESESKFPRISWLDFHLSLCWHEHRYQADERQLEIVTSHHWSPVILRIVSLESWQEQMMFLFFLYYEKKLSQIPFFFFWFFKCVALFFRHCFLVSTWH